MAGLAQDVRRTRLRRCFGLLLCVLLCVFAVGSKAALYKADQQQVKTFTSTKVWQNNAVPEVSATTAAIQVSSSLLLWFVLLLLVKVSENFSDVSEETALFRDVWFTPYLATRPPPKV